MTEFGVHSEVGRLRKVMVHRPELSLQRLTPTNHDGLLFDDVLFGLFHTRPVGHVLIWIAAGITLWSMAVYLKAAWETGAVSGK